MTNDTLLCVLVAVASLALWGGMVLGAVLEGWSWRSSADSRHHSHKSGGRWFTVCPTESPPR